MFFRNSDLPTHSAPQWEIPYLPKTVTHHIFNMSDVSMNYTKFSRSEKAEIPPLKGGRECENRKFEI